MFKKVSFLLLVFVVFSTSIASAHIMNSANSYSDLALTEVADEVVLLSALGVISNVEDSEQFNPSDVLTASDLAAWVAGFQHLQGNTTSELAQAAKAAGFVETVEGDAMYTQINAAYFNGKLELEQPTATMTREQFVGFMADHLQVAVNGQTLLEAAGFTEGPTGTIDGVQQIEKESTAGVTQHVYVLTIDGETYELGAHLRAIADSTDPQVWVGQSVAQSFVAMNHESDYAAGSTADNTQTAIQLIVIGDTPLLTAEEPQTKELEEALATVETDVAASTDTTGDEDASNKQWIYIAIIVMLVVLLVMALRRKK